MGQTARELFGLDAEPTKESQPTYGPRWVMGFQAEGVHVVTAEEDVHRGRYGFTVTLGTEDYNNLNALSAEGVWDTTDLEATLSHVLARALRRHNEEQK